MCIYVEYRSFKLKKCEIIFEFRADAMQNEDFLQTRNNMTDMEHDMNKPKCDKDQIMTTGHQGTILTNNLLSFYQN